MKNRILISILFSFFIFSVFSQEFKPKIIDIPESPNPEDFSFLKEELKDANVVMLGEFSHFNGDVFIYKAKIIEYLYKELGYKTIAFEGSVYDLYKAQQEIRKGESVDYAFQEALFGCWGKVEEFDVFKKFYAKNKKKLKIYGFDSQVSNSYASEFLTQDLFKFCKENKLDFELDFKDLEIIMESYTSTYKYHDEEISFKEFKNAFENLLVELKKLPENEERFIWRQTIESLVLDLSMIVNPLKQSMSEFHIRNGDVKRDRKMAQNLLEYIERYPEEKIICWGANAHFINNMPESSVSDLVGIRSMGTYVKEKLGKKMYSLAAATAFEEHKHRVFDTIFPTPLHPESFERFIRNQKKKHFFISSKQKAMDTMLQTRFLSDLHFVKSNPKNAFDGYLYFDAFKESTVTKENFTSKLDDLEIYITGKLVDEETKYPIPLAEVRLKKTVTFTDENGEFEIESKAYFSSNDSIRIDATGFEIKKVAIKDSRGIKLKAAENQLEEVVIFAKQNPYRLLKKTLKKVKRNYIKKPFRVDKYVHVSSNYNDSIQLEYEYVMKSYEYKFLGFVESHSRIKEASIIKGQIDDKYKIQPRDYKGFYFNNTILKKRNIKEYILKMESDSIIENKEVFVISFRAKKNTFKYIYKHGMYFKHSGKLYINKSDLAILRIEYYWKDEIYKRNNKRIVTFKPTKNKLYCVDKVIATFRTKDLLYKTKAFWHNIEQENVQEIERVRSAKWQKLKKVKYNKEFWDSFKRPTFEDL